MSKSYILNFVYNYLYRFYEIIAKVTKVTESTYFFDLGNNCKFYLLTDRIKTPADLNAFNNSLTERLNRHLSA